MRLSKLFKEFIGNSQVSGFILIFSTFLSLLFANFLLQDAYIDFWHIKVGFEIGDFHLIHSIEEWVNEGLMTIFFLLVGLEIEREVYIGELYPIRRAILPVFAALGGMLMPALLFILINWGLATQTGFGIPMATDIAFAIAILSLLGNKIPNSLKVLLTAIAIIDDLGSIIVIALFYGKTIDWFYLLLSLGLGSMLLIFNYLKIRSLFIYLPLGFLLWLMMLQTGIHATITGVFLAFAIPFEDGKEKSPSYVLQHFLHFPVSFVILPIFTLVNTALLIEWKFFTQLLNFYSIGIFVGLFIGKPLGISLAYWLTVKLKLARIPKGITFYHIVGMGFLAGIGFTMSIFITLLAFQDASVIQSAKLAILITSTLAGTVGFLILKNFKQLRIKHKRKSLLKKKGLTTTY
jgi:Na+:H+ antiporter, NhaA family